MTSVPRLSRQPSRAALRGWSLMETLVAVTVIGVLIAIALPVVDLIRQRGHKQVALQRFQQFGSALGTYTSQNAGLLPLEDADGNDDWVGIAKPEAKDAWYNALPRILGRKAAGEFSPREFYTDDNLVFLPGANYPDKKKFISPQFAIAFNTKLERNDPATGEKQRTRMEQVVNPARTVALLEQGCLNEDRTLEVQTRNDYDGAPKGSAKSFVGRYGGQGFILFLDGHAELVAVRDVLTETGAFPFPQGSIIWTRNPEENPNKNAAQQSKKKSDE